jgi:hypothetical protein
LWLRFTESPRRLDGEQHRRRPQRRLTACSRRSTAEANLEGVEGARPDVAEDHPQRREAECGQARGVRRARYRIVSDVRQRANSGCRRAIATTSRCSRSGRKHLSAAVTQVVCS